MYNFPFGGFPYYKNYYSRHYYPRTNNFINETEKNSTTSNSSSSTENENRSRAHSNDSQAFINILGIELYSDDILILCILFSLYLEGVKDEMLFICLILLLLS